MSSLPNALTVARIALVPLFVAAFFLPGEAGRWVVFILFCLAGVTDALASGREVILFESAGIGRSTGKVPDTITAMAAHALVFLDGLNLKTCDVLGFSLGFLSQWAANPIAWAAMPAARNAIMILVTLNR